MPCTHGRFKRSAKRSKGKEHNVTGKEMHKKGAQCRRLQHRQQRDGTGYVPLTTVLRCARHDSFAAGSDPSRSDSAGPHFFTIPSPAEGSTNSTWPRKGQAKVTRELLFFWTSCGGRHEAASGVHPHFGCVQRRSLRGRLRRVSQCSPS